METEPMTRPATAASPTEPTSHDIIVVGASFAGLALASAIGRATGGGLRILVLEGRPLEVLAQPPVREAWASAIAAASRNMLISVGAWEPIAAHAQAIDRIEITDSALGDVVRPVLLGWDNHLPDGTPASHIVENGRLLVALLAATRATAGIEIRDAVEVTGLETDDLAARVVLADGSSVSAPLVVAADGRGSKLRGLAGIGAVGRDYVQNGIVTIVALSRPHQGCAVQHFLPAGPFAVLPLPGDRACVTWTEQRDRAAEIMAMDDAAFLDALMLRASPRLGDMRLDGPRRSFPLSAHLARSRIAPRLALIGDAAQGVHPLAGQGLNLALRDAAALAEVVVDAARLGLDIGAATPLERYQRWRRADATLSAGAFDIVERVFSHEEAVLRGFRSAGLALVDRLLGLKHAMVREAAGLAGDPPRLLVGQPL